VIALSWASYGAAQSSLHVTFLRILRALRIGRVLRRVKVRPWAAPHDLGRLCVTGPETAWPVSGCRRSLSVSMGLASVSRR
jgi:hypothetical protein